MPFADPTEPVTRLIRRGPVTVRPSTTLREVCETLLREEVGVALVVSGEETIGLVSERDVASAVAQGADVDVDRVEDVMVFDVVAIRPDEPVMEAARRMLDGQIRHLLVGDRHRATGVISMRDVLAACVAAHG
jgi:predicted transcriptional regulator